MSDEIDKRTDPGFGVYIHWPFCAQKCPYCDFNSHVRFGGWDEPRFLAAYLRELDAVAGMLSTSPRSWGTPVSPNPLPPVGRVRVGGITTVGVSGSPSPGLPHEGGGAIDGLQEDRTVSSIFFGGGTPSLMKPQTVGAILEHIAKLWLVEANAEITLEANPGSVEATRFRGYRDAGVNRVSMGLQSLRDDELKKLGRIHTVAESKAALEIARKTFQRFSFDLIYARPKQTPQDWRAELAEALDLAGNHISLYQLTIEPDTPFAALHAAGKLVVPDADAALELYEVTQELTAARGLLPYEISNHAKPGEESRHNLLYWRYGEYAGVGPGAHGRLFIPSPRPSRGEGGTDRTATVTEKNPEAWVAAVERLGHGLTELTPLTRAEQADEMLLMGLRLREGIDLDRLARLGGVAPSAHELADLEHLGLIEVLRTSRQTSPQAGFGNWRADELEPIILCASPVSMTAPYAPTHIRATPRGRFVLNAVVARLSKTFVQSAAE